MSPTADNTITEKELDVEVVEKFEDAVDGVPLSLKDLATMVLDHPSVKQGVVILITDNDDFAEFKGHFYDNASLLSSILRDYKAKIYAEVFADADS